jgi:hypothetical protein
VFNAPTLNDMRVIVSRSLRDPNGEVFPTEVIDGFITEAMSELGSYRPKEHHEVGGWPLSEVAPDPNLLANGSFEDGTLAGWTGVDENTTSHYVGGNAPLGYRALQVRGGAPGSAYPGVGQTVPVTPGVTYHLGAWAQRLRGDKNAVVRLDSYKDGVMLNDGVLVLRWDPPGLTPSAWSFLEGWWEVPDDNTVDAVRVVIFIEADPTTVNDFWYFDGITLRGGSDVLPPPFTSFSHVWMVQYRVAYSSTDIRTTTIPPLGGQRWGWMLHQKRVVISEFWARQMTSLVDRGYPVELVVWGYAERNLPEMDYDVLDIEDNIDYLCVLNHCKHLGFELLNHDRALYQQWLAATNNTDVSPTQLLGMSSSAEQTFDRLRSRSMVVRRVPTSNTAVQY